MKKRDMTDRIDASNAHTIYRAIPPIRSIGLFLGAGFLAACASISPNAVPAHTHFIHIQDAVIPQRLEVHVGDEIRWQNLRDEPVKISLLSHLSGSSVSCQKGFSRFGSFDDTATIPPNAYASLCFAQTGSIHYNVWLNLQDPLRSMTPTAKITVSPPPT